MFFNTCITNMQIGEAAKLKPLEVDLKRLEDLSDAIVQDFSYMRKQEEEMRDTNGKMTYFETYILINYDLFLQNQQTIEYCSSAFSVCAVYQDWQHGKSYISVDSLKSRN